MEETLVIIKPDAIQRMLVGKIISRFEEKGLKIKAIKIKILEKELLEKHYQQHTQKPFFKSLVEFMQSNPSILLVLEGKEAIKIVRKIVGATNGRNAEPGTIRGDYSVSNQNNLVHASEDKQAAEKEIKLFFKKEELLNYELNVFKWLYNKEEKN